MPGRKSCWQPCGERARAPTCSPAWRATLIAVDGTAAHYLKFSVLRATEQLARLGLVLGLTDHVSDTAGVELLPLSFRSSAGLAAREGWDRDAAVLAFLEQDG